ncbi:SOS response associated peptidase (SRAP) [Belnapia rosea]|uniref:SOS response associated peptidase (SRAP) n=1 Tax=Belnapia rosea TaxID=938405 RepID=A0A1G6TUZ9_9PROT|nr:SOS response associated peptidase (SRAP) [Belnapia rosea]SDD32207.1 SOS response associated peptidase (SRAP) [Belnapia rosea]
MPIIHLVLRQEGNWVSRVLGPADKVRPGRDHPLAVAAGIWTRWTFIRKIKDGEATAGLFAFLTAEPNPRVGVVHPKAMPVILTMLEEIEPWLRAPAKDALELQRPLPDGSLIVVPCGERQDGAPAAT